MSKTTFRIVALGLTMAIGYGALYHVYGVHAPAITAEFGVGLELFFGAFSTCLLLAGLNWSCLFTWHLMSLWWARQDSNLQPDRYERPALTIELQAL
jgi:hypothetical protein